MARFLVSLVLLLALAACEPRPQLVLDSAGLLGTGEKERLELFHGLLLKDHDIDYRVITLDHAPDINALAAEAFAEQAIGTASSSGYGLLLFVDEAGQRVRLEVGYGLEGFFPDAFVAYVENRQMLPFFAAGRIADGILATTELIVDRAQQYALGNSDFEETLPGSGGAGATARIGQHALAENSAASGPSETGGSPGETLASYFNQMARRNGDPSLEIYTPETRVMLENWVMTPAQMDNLVSTYRHCDAQPPRFDDPGVRAVIRYPVAQRHCAPWFFQRNGDAWQLDLTMMSQAVRFGRDNSWHFDPSVNHPYEFGFADWRFDEKGYPFE